MKFLLGCLILLCLGCGPKCTNYYFDQKVYYDDILIDEFEGQNYSVTVLPIPGNHHIRIIIQPKEKPEWEVR